LPPHAVTNDRNKTEKQSFKPLKKRIADNMFNKDFGLKYVE